MKAVQAEIEGGYIEWKEIQRPQFAHALARHMIVVAVCAVGLSFADNLFLHGRYQVKKEMPIVPGLEGAGVMTAGQRGVIFSEAGDLVGFGSLLTGACAEEVLFHEQECWRLPAGLSGTQMAEYSSLGVNFMTAHFAFTCRSQVQSWHRKLILVLGAAGGVGLAGVQVAKVLGATVLACAGTEAKRSLCVEHGASEAIDYTN
jgi:NADPH2:quinone reductase|mmetsp:Transcript_27626/g.83195  ORF Transcript_27626/g.83195 Transcript_27626/m.83195 type:complete len:202 (-) Transcript_27626:527-1132(-)